MLSFLSKQKTRVECSHLTRKTKMIFTVFLFLGILVFAFGENNSSIPETWTNESLVVHNATVAEIIATQSLSFILLGDWGKGGLTGKYGSSVESMGISCLEYFQRWFWPKQKSVQAKAVYQMAVAKSMGEYTQNSSANVSFIVALGDNFYGNGVSSSTDVLWSYLWKNVYLDYPGLNIPWYPVFGNHDYGGSTDAQIQRYLDHTDDDIWMFEAQYYLKEFSIPGGGTVAILCIDTTTLAPSVNKYCNENGGVSQETQLERITEQMTFINETLGNLTGRAERPTWLFVAGHYPVFSVGSNGDTGELQTYLQPALEHYGVDAYFCGHDHMSEHLEHNGVHYFVAGGGSMIDYYKKATAADQTLFLGEGYSAFAVVNATATSYSVKYVDTSGAQRYSFVGSAQSPGQPSSSPSAAPSMAPNSSAPSLSPTASPALAAAAADDEDSSSSVSSPSVFEAVRGFFEADSTRSRVALITGGLLALSVVVILTYAACRGGNACEGNGRADGTAQQLSGRDGAMQALRGDVRTRTDEEEDDEEEDGGAGDEETGHAAGNPLRGLPSTSKSSSRRSYTSTRSRDTAGYVELTTLRANSSAGHRRSASLLTSRSPLLSVSGSSNTPSRGGSTTCGDLHHLPSVSPAPKDLTDGTMRQQTGGGGSADCTPSDVTPSNGSDFESELRLRLFDAMVGAVAEEDSRAGSGAREEGRMFGRGPASSPPGGKHKRVATAAV